MIVSLKEREKRWQLTDGNGIIYLSIDSHIYFHFNKMEGSAFVLEKLSTPKSVSFGG